MPSWRLLWRNAPCPYILLSQLSHREEEDSGVQLAVPDGAQKESLLRWPLVACKALGAGSAVNSATGWHVNSSGCHPRSRPKWSFHSNPHPEHEQDQGLQRGATPSWGVKRDAVCRMIQRAKHRRRCRTQSGFPRSQCLQASPRTRHGASLLHQKAALPAPAAVFQPPPHLLCPIHDFHEFLLRVLEAPVQEGAGLPHQGHDHVVVQEPDWGERTPPSRISTPRKSL